jgi:tRNA-specific adenosine deaminase 1
MPDAQAIASAALAAYARQAFAPPPGQHTVLAAFALSRADAPPAVLALATGTKCLPTARFPARGEALLDSHAEVLARRGARRWFLEELARAASGGAPPEWIERGPDGLFALRPGVELSLYVSTPPCEARPSLPPGLGLMRVTDVACHARRRSQAAMPRRATSPRSKMRTWPR